MIITQTKLYLINNINHLKAVLLVQGMLISVPCWSFYDPLSPYCNYVNIFTLKDLDWAPGLVLPPLRL